MTTTQRRPPQRRPQVQPGVPRIGAKKPVRPATGPKLGRPQVRLNVAVAFAVIAATVLGGRLVQLQGIDSTVYAAKGTESRLSTTVLPATRGAITDRWGKVLSRNVETRLIAIDPTLLAETDKDAAAAALAPVLGQTADTLRPLLDKPGRYVVLARGLDITAARAALNTRLPGSALSIPGLVSATEETRDHPAGVVGAQVVGVTSTAVHTCPDGKTDTCLGLSGIEYTQENVLAGKAGTTTEEVDPAGRVIPQGEDHTVAAVQGSDVRLTLDRDVQYTAQTVLNQEVTNTHARGGHIVVMDPHSGEILAIASSPGFDASQWASGKVDPSQLQLPAVTDVYEPGSVNKVITAAAALDTHAFSPDSEVTVEPELHVAGRAEPIKDAEVHGTEHLTFTGVLAHSSNIGTDHIAQKLGNDTLYKYLRAFGMGSSTHSGLPGESGGILHPVQSWDPSEAATIPFGQGMSATALQIASVYATIANGGVRVEPSIVRGIVKPDGTYVPSQHGKTTQVISKQAATTLSQMLETVATNDGTAPLAAIPGYRVAGKTGTAEALTNGRYDGGYVSSFVGFAPADNPRLVVSVVLDHPQGSYFGGAVAAPVFRAVMGFALRAYQVKPTMTRRPQLRITYDQPAEVQTGTSAVAPVTPLTPKSAPNAVAPTAPAATSTAGQRSATPPNP